MKGTHLWNKSVFFLNTLFLLIGDVLVQKIKGRNRLSIVNIYNFLLSYNLDKSMETVISFHMAHNIRLGNHSRRNITSSKPRRGLSLEVL